MNRIVQELEGQPIGALIFRVALFAAAASLAAYIPFKYATQLHTIQGIYAFLFPLSGLLALTGMALAVKPSVGCKLGVSARAALGSVAALWMATGLLCVSSLAAMFPISIWGGAIAVFHMTVQHVFLSAAILAFAFAPSWMARKLGVGGSEQAPSVVPDRALQA
jgi:hypothetical protein